MEDKKSSFPLPLSYYQQDDVLYLSRHLLGKYLLTNIDGKLTGGVIIETEAYRGPEDRASHAFANRRTKRNEVMYAQGGISYVFICYGIHAMLNIVTNKKDIPHAILVRALAPMIGIEVMVDRRMKKEANDTLTSGPGSLCQALGITKKHNGIPLQGPTIWIEDRGIKVSSKEIIAGPRVGIDYAGEDAKLPWRFQIALQRFKEKNKK